MTKCYRCSLPTDDEGVCRERGCSESWEALIAERDNYKASARDLAAAYEKASRERDQFRADGLLVLEHYERQKGYEELLRQAIQSLIEVAPEGLPCTGDDPCAICCAQAVLG